MTLLINWGTSPRPSTILFRMYWNSPVSRVTHSSRKPLHPNFFSSPHLTPLMMRSFGFGQSFTLLMPAYLIQYQGFWLRFQLLRSMVCLTQAQPSYLLAKTLVIDVGFCLLDLCISLSEFIPICHRREHSQCYGDQGKTNFVYFHNYKRKTVSPYYSLLKYLCRIEEIFGPAFGRWQEK